MALRNYKPKTDSILVGDEQTEIRGLTLNDVSLLIESHWPSITDIYEQFQAAKTGAVSFDEQMSRTILDMIRTAPDLSGAIIACAASEPDQVETAKSLPFTVQVDALAKIVTLTLSEVGGLGNFLAVLQRITSAMRTVMPAAPEAPPAMIADPFVGTH